MFCVLRQWLTIDYEKNPDDVAYSEVRFHYPRAKGKSYVFYRGKDFRVMSILHFVCNGSGDDIHAYRIIFEAAIMHQMYVNSLLRVVHIHDLLLVLFRSSTRMFVVLRTFLIWNHQYHPKGGRRALRPASDDRSRPRRTLRHTKGDKLYR